MVTLEDVHADQLCTLGSTTNLVLQEILSLAIVRWKKNEHARVRLLISDCKWTFSILYYSFNIKVCVWLTLALSRLRICSWKAAGVFSAEKRNTLTIILKIYTMLTDLHTAHYLCHTQQTGCYPVGVCCCFWKLFCQNRSAFSVYNNLLWGPGWLILSAVMKPVSILLDRARWKLSRWMFFPIWPG